MGLMKAPNPQTGNWEGVDALALNDDKGERVTVARIKATESQLAENSVILDEFENETSYVLGFLNNVNKMRTRAILSINGFYGLADGADGKYRVLSVTGDEVWTDIIFSNTNKYQLSSIGELRAFGSTKKLKVMPKHGIYNVKMYGAKGDGTQNDTLIIQKALDGAEGTLHFPNGIYKVGGTGEACLYLTKKLNITGNDPSYSKIRADNAGIETSILKVSITSQGSGDIRNWKMFDIGMFFNGGGKHALVIAGGLSILTSEIKNCSLMGNEINGGYSIATDITFAHSKIQLNTLGRVLLPCGDANLIEKNVFIGTGTAVVFNLNNGVRNNTVRNNTFANRDGAIHIINGSNIRIENNQIEHGTTSQVSQNAKKTMVWIEGKDRESHNIIISENNFGGGTNLDHLIYVDNARKTVIEKNYLISVNIAEIKFTANSKYNILKRDNQTLTQSVNPRTDTAFKAVVIDEGVGNAGTLQGASTLNLNSWTEGSYFKDETGMVNFINGFSGGSTVVDTVIGTLPIGFRPSYGWYPCITSSGMGYVLITAAGEIKVKNLPSNAGVKLLPFLSNQTE